MPHKSHVNEKVTFDKFLSFHLPNNKQRYVLPGFFLLATLKVSYICSFVSWRVEKKLHNLKVVFFSYKKTE